MATIISASKNLVPAKDVMMTISSFSHCYIDDYRYMVPENINEFVFSRVIVAMTKFVLSHNIQHSFYTSIKGYEKCIEFMGEDRHEYDIAHWRDAKRLLSRVSDIEDDDSVYYACQACTYDLWQLDPDAAGGSSVNVGNTKPNQATIRMVRLMVNRVMMCFKKFGRVRRINTGYGPNGYTDTIARGICDFLSEDTMWHVGVFKDGMKPVIVMQTLISYVMAQHSGNEVYKGVRNIGIINPRENLVYRLDVARIKPELIQVIEKEYIRY